MKIVTGKINKYEVKIIAVEAGEKPRQVREDAGLGIDDEYIFSARGDDFEDAKDLRWGFPETAKLMEDSGVDLSTLRGYFEIIVK